MLYSITAALVLSTPSVANRIQRDFSDHALSVEVDATVDEPLQTGSVPPGAGDAVDWHFMTDRFSWAGRADQEEYDIVQGHSCQGNGYYDQSYYASSLCYWHPETEHVEAQHWGLAWRGGYGPREWCGGLGLQRGVCAKCSVCHDNSRDRDARVDAAQGQLEIIPLPECMKEVAIEAECNHDFEASNPELVGEEARCREMQGRHDEAVANWNTIDNTIQSSESSITDLIHQIGHGQPQEAHCGEQTLQDIRQGTVRACRSFGVRGRHSNREMFDMRPECVTKTYVRLAYGAARCEEGREITSSEECEQALRALNLPVGPAWNGNNDGIPSACSVREEGQAQHMHWNRRSSGRGRADLAPVCVESVNTDQRCERCTSAMDSWQIALEANESARVGLEAWPQSLANYEEQMTHHRQVLAQSYQTFPQATHQKGAMEAEWLPQQQHCEQVYVSSRDARNSHVMACAPRYYDQSCEKACVEIQRSGEHGCGVVEGSQYGDQFQRGGVEVTCSPPAPSWIMSPSNYGGSPHVNSGEQCGRINPVQSARATTPVLLTGWLHRACESCWFGTMYRRFFVLESGNGVRSATLRSFDDALPDGTEETNDGIIMWDAEEVSASETTGEQACFELKHRYRGRETSWYRSGTTYTMCVKSDDYPRANIAGLRDQWVSVLQELFVWRPRVA